MELLPLPQYAFMAWFSLKAQGQIYLYLTLPHNKQGLIFVTEMRCVFLEVTEF